MRIDCLPGDLSQYIYLAPPEDYTHKQKTPLLGERLISGLSSLLVDQDNTHIHQVYGFAIYEIYPLNLRSLFLLPP